MGPNDEGANVRVFMLGWEFPPFISGGLGTACYGLTRALDQLGVKVTFVLPKRVDSEYVTHVRLLTPGAMQGADGAGACEAQWKNVSFRSIASSLQAYATPDRYEQRIEESLRRRMVSGAGDGAEVRGGLDYGGDLYEEVQRYAALVLRLAQQEEFDVVHAHDWMTYPAGVAVAARTGKPLVVHIHSTEFDRSGEHVNQVVYDVEREGMERAGKVIAVSHYTRGLVTERYGIPAEKVDVVYNGVERNRRWSLAETEFQRDEKIVLFLGRITMQKGPEYFLQAAKRVLEVMDHVKFVMAGSGDMMYRSVELAARLGIGHRVLFTGFLRGDDVHKIFRMADLYVMPSVCFYFQVHQPMRLRHYTVFDRGDDYFDEHKNAAVCRKVAHKCYLPANRLLLKLINRHQGRFRIAYSLTGVLLEQLERYCPEVLSTFHALAETGCVEFLAETYYHSLSFQYSRREFIAQVREHLELIEALFGCRPTVFRNTELIYNNDLALLIEAMGCFDAIIAEGADCVLNGRSPNFVYRPQGCRHARLLLKNYALSDDIAFRFSNRNWTEWPLTAGKFAQWISAVNGSGNVVNLFMDYETLGEHQWADTGIFEFMRHLPDEILRHPDNDFKTPSEVAAAYEPVDDLDVPQLISWADTERDLSAWLGNAMQSSALHELYRLEKKIKAGHDERVRADWRRLQVSDHFYYMCTKYFADGDVHKYFNPYDSPYDSYINFMNVLGHLEGRCTDGASARPVVEVPARERPSPTSVTL